MTPDPHRRLAGRRILITGASRGIGAAVARAAAGAGAEVALTARTAGSLERLAAEIEGAGGRSCALPADVTRPDEVLAMIETGRARLGGLDSAVINQGINRLAPLSQMTPGDWDAVIATNLTGSFLVARGLAAGGFAAPGAMVFVSSVSALPEFKKFPGFAAYSASKRGLLGLAEVLALESRESGGRVYAVCPRGVDTEMYRSTFPGARAELEVTEAAARIVDLLDPATAPDSGSVLTL